MSKISKAVVVVALGTVGACTKVDSENILTRGIYADIAARTTGKGTTTVSATLYLEDPANLNFVDLTGDDTLIAINGAQSKEMIEQDILSHVSHHAEFLTDVAGEEFVVDFQRTVDGGAPQSIATLPTAFDLLQIGAPVSRAQELVIEWSPAIGSEMTWELSGPCIDFVTGGTSADTGLATISANTIKKTMGQNIPDSCEVTVTVTRTLEGVLDPGFGKGGVVVGEQVRTLTFTSTR